MLLKCLGQRKMDTIDNIFGYTVNTNRGSPQQRIYRHDCRQLRLEMEMAEEAQRQYIKLIRNYKIKLFNMYGNKIINYLLLNFML